MFYKQLLFKWRPRTLLMITVFVMMITFCFLLYYKHEIDEEMRRNKKVSQKFLTNFEITNKIGRVDKRLAKEDETTMLMTDGRKKMYRVVHLDLKGAPPKVSYLRTLFPLFAAAGANSLLIEYEDMFPYEGSLKNISALNAYTRKNVKEILSLAKENNLEVIPLVQTFGHLEFALKLKEFKHLRELEAFPQEVCPSNPDSLRVLVYEMIDQVMELHPDTRFLHIGCDEVFHIAACGRCTSKRLNDRTLFTDHVTQVANRVRGIHHVTPLVWDDMFRQWSPVELEDSGLGNLVEPVVWVYITDITNLVPHYVWHMYGNTFPHIWVASAFKGAYGETNLLPNIDRHLSNHLAWIRLMRAKQPDPVKTFRGMMLTGWSRYDHFAVLCELLPPSLPSLLLNLLVVTRSMEAKRDPTKLTTRDEEKQLLLSVLDEWKTILDCRNSFPKKLLTDFNGDPFVMSLKACDFPGSNLFTRILRLISLKMNVERFKKKLTIDRGWMTNYNVKHNFSSPWRVIEGYSASGESGMMIRTDIDLLSKDIGDILTQYFDEFSVKEWIEQNIEPMAETMNDLENSAQGLLARHDWPRRPLT